MNDGDSGQIFRAILLGLLMVSCYSAIPFVSSGRLLVPSYPTFLLLPVVIFLVWPRLSTLDETFVPKIAFVLLLTIALSPGYDHVEEKFLGLTQICVAMITAVLIVRLMGSMHLTILERTLMVLWVLIVIGSALEVAGVIRGLSDAFRARTYVAYDHLYDSDLRDISLVGWVRPKLFTSEPSHVTKGFIAFVNCWLLVRFTWVKMWITLGATAVMLGIMGSPMILASASMTLMIGFFSEAKSGARIAVLMSFALAGVVGLMMIPDEAISGLTWRLVKIWNGTGEFEMSSSNRRLVFPYLTLIDTWLRWPLFGVGISGKEVVAEYTRLPINPPILAIGNNAMAEHGTYLGIVGGSLFFYLLFRHIQHTGVRRLGLMLVIAVCFSQLMGGMESIRYWGYIGLFWGALAVSDSTAEIIHPPSVQRQTTTSEAPDS